MTPEEQALELAKKSIEQVFEPYKDLLHSLLGPATTQIGLTLGDQLAFWRSKRAARFLKDFYQFALENDLKVKPVSPRLLLPIFENGPLEDDEDLYIRWIALLANAATCDKDSQILPCFPDILKQLTAEEAQFLDKAYNEVIRDTEARRSRSTVDPTFYGDGGNIHIGGDLLKSASPIMVDDLERLKLVTRIDVPLTFDRLTNTFPAANHLYISELGRAFVRACRLPNK